MLIDIHTHKANTTAGVSLVDTGENLEPPRSAETVYSAGIHPCHIGGDWRERAERISGLVAGGRIAAIGECGFDRTSAVPAGLQDDVFRAMAAISSRHAAPMVIHCVHAADLLLRHSRAMPFAGAWIVHGYRGKPAAMAQLLKAGFAISFAANANAESVARCPREKIFLETDTAPNETLRESYRTYSAIRGENLEQIIEENFRQLFSRTLPAVFQAT